MKLRIREMSEIELASIQSCFNELGLYSKSMEDGSIVSPITYEDGTNLALVAQSVWQKGLFTNKKRVLLTAATAENSSGLLKSHLHEFVVPPRFEGDLPFEMAFAMNVQSMAWAVGEAEGWGNCRELPNKFNGLPSPG